MEFFESFFDSGKASRWVPPYYPMTCTLTESESAAPFTRHLRIQWGASGPLIHHESLRSVIMTLREAPRCMLWVPQAVQAHRPHDGREELLGRTAAGTREPADRRRTSAAHAAAYQVHTSRWAGFHVLGTICDNVEACGNLFKFDFRPQTPPLLFRRCTLAQQPWAGVARRLAGRGVHIGTQCHRCAGAAGEIARHRRRPGVLRISHQSYSAHVERG